MLLIKKQEHRNSPHSLPRARKIKSHSYRFFTKNRKKTTQNTLTRTELKLSRKITKENKRKKSLKLIKQSVLLAPHSHFKKTHSNGEEENKRNALCKIV